MRNYNSLSIGDISPDGSVKIIDQDRLCYVIQSSNRGAKGIRTISKKLLNEFVEYLDTNNEATANNARESLCGKTDIDKFEYGYAASLIQMAKMILEKGIVCKTNADESLQQIYYGAPGTGKSHKIKEKLAGVSKENIFRTTFHPDSDYSTFVGAYKPSTDNPKEKLYNKEELISKLTELKEQGVTYAPQKFGAQYWYSLKRLTLQDKKDILAACEMSDNYTVEFDKGIAVGEELLKKSKESRIIYKFIPQAFLNAYMRAYSTTDKVYLVIEEINRGNCAQIFGDLFQLLDRNDYGFSDYYIHADKDIQKHLSNAFKDYLIKDSHKDAINSLYPKEDDVVAKVLSGEILLLPNNLYIWATMNTSDQSLFPIDSAFKRRWDWKYIKIANAHKGWQIKVGTKAYDWWQFVQAINYFVFDATQSEDKNLGYFFAKAKDGVVTAETFVSKVVFYLYTDVFKDYGFSGDIFKGEKDEEMTFQSFYNADGSPCEAQILRFIENVMFSDALPEALKATPIVDDEDISVYNEDETIGN